MSSDSKRRDELTRAIAALEEQRTILGDSVVDAAVESLQNTLTSLRDPDSAEQQRKHATVLLADISDSTALSELLDAEELSDTYNAVWERIDRVIVEHGGTIDKHIGDAVLALWGVDRAREDDPERAIRAALDIQVAAASLRAELGLPLRMHIGINTGAVLLGDVGTTGEFSAVGGAVNIARRIQEAASPAEVLVSHDTYRHVRGIFDFQPQDPLVIKGAPRPIRTYAVVQAKQRAFRMATRGVEGVETRMVGRDAELLALQDLMRRAIEEDRTQIVTITGEAGVGKSRLLYEFEKWIDLLPERIWYFKGRATPSMQSVPYGVIRDMFAYRFEILETDRPATVIAKLREGMAGALDGQQADLVGHLVGFDTSTSPAVRNLLGSPSFGQLSTAYLTDYIRHMAQKPTIMFLEDMHWADDASLSFIDHLAAEMPATHLLVVCLARPPLFERMPEWEHPNAGRNELDAEVPRSTARSVLLLDPLSAEDSRALVDEILQLADHIPPSLRELVVDGAEGNPYYVEEFIKRLIDDGVITRNEDSWHIAAQKLTAVDVPATLTGVLQARLDSLPRSERAVLHRASVVGRLFWDAAVARLAAEDLDASDIANCLEALCDRELIFAREPSTFEGTREFMFKHALLHDVTYETVLLKHRPIYHGRVAQWLEQNAGERLGEYYEPIAGHCIKAGQLTKAADYLRRSGQELHLMGAYRDAVAAYDRALSVLPEESAQTRAALLVSSGNASRQMGSYPRAERQLKEGLALARQTQDAAIEVEALNGLALWHRVRGSTDQAELLLREALDTSRGADDRRGVAVSLYNLGDVAFRRGRGDDALRLASESLAICRDIGDLQGTAFALRVMGFAANLREDYEEAIRCHQQSLATYQEIGDRWGMAACHINLGETCRKQGRLTAAVGHLTESLAIATTTGARYELAIVNNNLGHVYIGMDRAADARACLCEALTESLEMAVVPIALESLIGLAELQLRDDEHSSAAELIGLVLAHPALTDETSQYADPVLEQLRRWLPKDELDAALSRGASMEASLVVDRFCARTLE